VIQWFKSIFHVVHLCMLCMLSWNPFEKFLLIYLWLHLNHEYILSGHLNRSFTWFPYRSMSVLVDFRHQEERMIGPSLDDGIFRRRPSSRRRRARAFVGVNRRISINRVGLRGSVRVTENPSSSGLSRPDRPRSPLKYTLFDRYPSRGTMRLVGGWALSPEGLSITCRRQITRVRVAPRRAHATPLLVFAHILCRWIII